MKKFGLLSPAVFMGSCPIVSIQAFAPSVTPTSPLLGKFRSGRSTLSRTTSTRQGSQHVRPRQKSVKLQSALTSVLSNVNAFWIDAPYAAAALTCGVKASAADLVAQRRQFRKEQDDQNEELESENASAVTSEAPKADLQRNLAYLIYGALYQGMTQEFVYNHIYPSLFGTGTDPVTVLTKVSFDLLIQTTILTLPIAYLSKAVIYRYGFKEAIRRYVDDIRNHGLLLKYFALWGPVQCLTFSIIPEHFRVTFIALVSFFWLIILSSIASKTPVHQEAAECPLEDGQTCHLDG